MNSVLTKNFVNGNISNFTLTVKFSGSKDFAGEPEALEKALHHLVQWENDHKKANKTGPTPVKQLLTSLANEEDSNENDDDEEEELDQEEE